MRNLTKLVISATVVSPVSAHAADGQLLMLAAQLGFMKAIEVRCDGLIPGYGKEFKAAYAAAKENMFDKVGLTEEVFAQAAAYPELAITPMVEKFDKQEEATRKQFCQQNLDSVKDAAVAKKETSE